jgi:hypothetical protein
LGLATLPRQQSVSAMVSRRTIGWGMPQDQHTPGEVVLRRPTGQHVRFDETRQKFGISLSSDG